MNRYKLTMEVGCVVEAPDKETAGALMAELPLDAKWWLPSSDINNNIVRADGVDVENAKGYDNYHEWKEVKEHLKSKEEVIREAMELINNHFAEKYPGLELVLWEEGGYQQPVYLLHGKPLELETETEEETDEC